MNDELDAILADQYHSTKRRLKTVKRLRKIANCEKDQEHLDHIEQQIHMRMRFFENMTHDKELLKKKNKKKKSTNDILSRNPMKDMVKNVYWFTNISVKLMNRYWNSYMSLWSIYKEK